MPTAAASAKATCLVESIRDSDALLYAPHWTVAGCFESSSPCLQVRGKTVYLQYSTRNEIVNAGGGGGERPSNCLLVTLENLDVRTCSGPCCQSFCPRPRPWTELLTMTCLRMFSALYRVLPQTC